MSAHNLQNQPADRDGSALSQRRQKSDGAASGFLRLRQICLVAPSLEPAVATVQQVLGLTPCHRDPGVGKYGLGNALFACGYSFIEIVAPLRDGTAAARFLERSGGRGGYMAIFDCNDSMRRGAHAESIGVRIAHHIDYEFYQAAQLHPRDCRATMIEFGCTPGNERLDANYYPGGPHWQQGRRPNRVSGIPAIEVTSPNPTDIAAHWSRIVERPVTTTGADQSGGASTHAPNGQPGINFDLGRVDFVAGAPGDSAEYLSAMLLSTPQPDAMRDAAQRAGLAMQGDGFWFCGVLMRPVSEVKA